MQTEKILLTTSIAAAVTLPDLRFVNFAGGLPTAGQRTLGITNANYSAGEQAGVKTHGELLVETGGAITIGAEVETDTAGRAVARSTGVTAGVARDAASGAGEFIRVMR